MRTLNVIESAYRATAEEQDDTIIWLAHAMLAAGAELDVLLVRSAVAYAATGQAAPALVFGEWKQSRPPSIAADLVALAVKGARIYAVAEDLEERGLTHGRCIGPLVSVPRAQVADLYGEYGRVWQW